MDKINYAEKVLNFNLIVGNQNEEIAYKYLSKAFWDEAKAAQLFNEDTKKMEESLSKYIQMKERKQKMKPKHISNYPEYKIDSINNIFNKITYFFKEDNNKYFFRYSKIKNAVQLLDDFILKLKTNGKTGVIILYSSNQILTIKEQLQNIIKEPLSKELFFDNTYIYPVINISPEGDNFINELNCTKLPLFIICKYKNEESLAIIGKLEIPFKLCDFRDKILESEQAFYDKNLINQKNKKTNIINNSINEENKNSSYRNDKNNNNKKEYVPDYNDYDFEDEGIDFINNFPENNNMKMTDGQVLAFQELKIRELEKIEEQKQIEEKKLMEEKEKYKNIIDKELEESKKIAEKLKPEPDDNNPDKCIILFRFPDGEKSVQRKFLKQDKISLLYDFIKSLGRDIFTENEHHHFSLLQTFPFKSFDEKKDNTLEEEGLFPNSVLQIKELE